MRHLEMALIHPIVSISADCGPDSSQLAMGSTVCHEEWKVWQKLLYVLDALEVVPCPLKWLDLVGFEV